MSKAPIETEAGLASIDGKPAEKRQYPRATVALAAVYEVAERTGKTTGKIVNLGGGGARLTSAEDLAQGAAVNLEFALPGSTVPMSVRGKVVLSFYDAALPSVQAAAMPNAGCNAL